MAVYDERTPIETHIALSENDAVTNLQQLGQQWERLLYATGGSINIEKSFWYMLSWTWNKSGNAKLKTIQQSPSILQLTSGRDTTIPVTVPRIETSASFRTLGAHISPSGSQTITVQHFRSQATAFASCIASSSLN
jgi:hypothetical protein